MLDSMKIALLTFIAMSLACPAFAQDTAGDGYQPQIGQLGKDVVWVPTPDRLIYRMLQLADVTSRDVVVDLGSGDGRIPIAAARGFGARGIGVEFDAKLVEFSRRAAERERVAERVQFLQMDMFRFDLSVASVVALYISPTLMTRLRPTLLQLKPGVRVVSHQFTLGDWEPDEMVRVENTPGYLWIVPGKAGGAWKLRLDDQEYDLRLDQEHQMLRGTAAHKGKSGPVIAARMRGNDVRFSFVDRDGYARAFTGRVTGNTMEGTARAYDRPELRWSATRH
jgi:SAM-dependent methyltransferase